MIAAAMVVGGLVLIAAAVVFFAWLGRDLPALCDDILTPQSTPPTIPQGEPVSRDVGGADFDTHADQALAIANTPPPACPALVWCAQCDGPFHAHTLADILGHIRDTHSPAAPDWAAWETELATPTRKDQS